MKRLARFIPLPFLFAALSVPAEAQVSYGRAVAIAGDEVFIGEPGNQVTPGFVYVYRRGASGWEEVLELAASDAKNRDGFGAALAVEGDMLLVSATGNGNGVVYVLERSGNSWNEVGKIEVEGLSEGDRFGGSLAASGDYAIIGNANHAEGRGAAYIFRRGQGGWNLVATLLPEEEEEEGFEEPQEEQEQGPRRRPPTPRFGSAVAIRGEWAMVGAPGEADRSGSVYAYRRQQGGWEQLARIRSPGAQPNSSFGSAISVGDGEFMAGATSLGTVGAVAVFALDEAGAQWSPSALLFPFDGTPGTSFGSAIAFNDKEALIGAPGASGFQGVVYRYTRDADGRWTDASKIGTLAVGRRAGLAGSLAAKGDLLVAGAPRDDFGAGTAVIMERSYSGWDRSKVFSAVKGLDPIVGEGVPCEDGKADLWECSNVDLVAYLPIHKIGGGRGVSVNDIWGWTDPETSRDYTIVGMTDRASFVDVTDPSNPIYVGALPKTRGSNASIWRDIKVHANHAYIVSDSAGEHGVQILDLRSLREFDGTPLILEEDAHYDRINSAHNIVINEETAVAYVVGASGGGETCGGGLHMINIEDPRQPLFEGCFADTKTGRRGNGYAHDAQCIIYNGPDERYSGHEICFGSNETALSVADVTDKRNPVAISTATYPNVAYTHQGWITEDHRYFYMNDEGDEPSGTVEGTRTLIFDVQELDDPILVGSYIHDVQSTDHNLYIVGDRVYESNYDSGLRILDISDPENPKLAGYFDTVPWSGMGSWSNYPFFESAVVLVTSGREGLFVLRHSRRGDDPNDDKVRQR